MFHRLHRQLTFFCACITSMIFLFLGIACLAAVVVAVLVYFVLLIVFRCVDESELRSLPMGGKMTAAAKKLHLM